MATQRIVGLPELRRKLGALDKRVFPAAMVAALNRTATTVRADAVKTIARELGVKSKLVRANISIRKANRNRLQSDVEVSGKQFNLKEYGARQTRRGVSAKPYNQRRIFPHAFIVNRFGGRVFRRERRGGRLVGRLPIMQLFGPPLGVPFIREEVKAARERLVRTTLTKRLEAEVAFRVNRLKA